MLCSYTNILSYRGSIAGPSRKWLPIISSYWKLIFNSKRSNDPIVQASATLNPSWKCKIWQIRVIWVRKWYSIIICTKSVFLFQNLISYWFSTYFPIVLHSLLLFFSWVTYSSMPFQLIATEIKIQSSVLKINVEQCAHERVYAYLFHVSPSSTSSRTSAPPPSQTPFHCSPIHAIK